MITRRQALLGALGLLGAGVVGASQPTEVKGTVIGQVGSTGNSIGPHIHFELPRRHSGPGHVRVAR